MTLTHEQIDAIEAKLNAQEAPEPGVWPLAIWLQHPDDADPEIGQLWAEDKVWPIEAEDKEPALYVLAFATQIRELCRLAKIGLKMEKTDAALGSKLTNGRIGLKR